MKNKAILVVLIAMALLTGCASSGSRREPAAGALAHNVYFTLTDNSPAARATLVDACYRYLKDHPGVTFFAAGQIVDSHAREVNVRDWDVGLHVVFESKAHHDRYQNAQDHLTFIAENKDNWKTVHVFDTLVR